MNTHARSSMITFCKLTNLSRIEFLTLINRNSQFLFKKCCAEFFEFFLWNLNRSFCMLKGDPHQPLRSVASDLGLRCLYMSYKKDVRLVLVKIL